MNLSQYRKSILLWSICALFIVTTGSYFIHYLIEARIDFEIQTTKITRNPLLFQGTKDIARNIITLEPGSLINKDVVSVTYNLHGVCLLDGPASAISMVAINGEKYSVSLSRYGKNCVDGEQTTEIPLRDFPIDQPIKDMAAVEIQFWYPVSFAIEIKKLKAYPPVSKFSFKKVENLSAQLISQVTPAQKTSRPTSANTSPLTIPPSLLSNYYAEYWNTPGVFSKPTFPTGTPTLSRIDSDVNFYWGSRSPDQSISQDHFAARWTKTDTFDAGTYRLAVGADDGVRVYIDDTLIVKNWVDQPVRTQITNIALTGGIHTIKIEYYENAGGAVMQFKITKVATTPTPLPTQPIPSPTSTSQTTTSTAPITPSLKPVIPKQTPPVPVPKPTSTPTASPVPVIPPPSPTTPSPQPTPAPVSTPPISAPVLTQNSSWAIRSVSSMKETKDKVCNPDKPEFISAWITKAKELGVNYIAVETPYDNPTCNSSVAYTKLWVDAIHTAGLHVWHRHAPLAFEGIYGASKDKTKDYIALITQYIKAHPDFFKEDDIFTPIPEPQNGGIAGITYCPQNICIFSGAKAFNQWLRDAITSSENAFREVNLGGKIKIGYYGLDGFITWGDNNPDWHGILEDATVQAMGNITIDHYPEIVGDTMENDLNELQAKYPNTPIIIGEWGTITGGNTVDQIQKSMQAALRKNVVGFNYWHMGLGGNEALINNNLSNKLSFDAVKAFFTR